MKSVNAKARVEQGEEIGKNISVIGAQVGRAIGTVVGDWKKFFRRYLV